MHNFAPQLATWQVVISGYVMVGHVGTHFHYSQLVSRYVANCSIKLCNFMCL